MAGTFDNRFQLLTGNPPFPWQRALYELLLAGDIPPVCNISTGLGKTSILPIWLLARSAGAPLPCRLVYVVNRRTVVDQTTLEVERLAARLADAGITEPLAISTLRGQRADNRAWSEDPSRPAVICGTVDMIGSRLLFSGYRTGYKLRPLHAGFLGQDALLVHDEAHLEPAFQALLERIVEEQRRCGDGWPLEAGPGGGRLRVMALTATARTTQDAFGLTARDYAEPAVDRRLRAAKRLSLHPVGERELVSAVVAKLRTYADSGRAVLVFLRTVDDVASTMAQLRKLGIHAQQLTGTMRGEERNRLVDEDPIVGRFLAGVDGTAAPRAGAVADSAAAHRAGTVADSAAAHRTGTVADSAAAHRTGTVADSAAAPRTGTVVDGAAAPRVGTVVLVCTSAGEVGVNLSGDHLVCDLTTFDSMAQRFGRLNRFGAHKDSGVHVFHPAAESLKADKAPDAEARRATLTLLGQLHGDASPAALDRLDPAARLAAFAPAPRILPATEILFDAWSLTTIQDDLPGRPPVSDYLHGVAEWEPPTTQVAWRDEVDRIDQELLARHFPDSLRDARRRRAAFLSELFDDYPLKPHELLSDRTSRVVATLLDACEQHGAGDTPAWILDEQGRVQLTTLARIVDGDRKQAESRIAGCTLLLPPSHCRPVKGGLAAAGWAPRERVAASEAAAGEGAAASDEAATGDLAEGDVADRWLDEQGEPRRVRRLDGEERPAGMRLIRTIVLRDPDDSDEDTASPVRWSWYERPRGADSDGSRSGAGPVLLEVHSKDAEDHARRIVERLRLPPGIRRAVTLAARHHDRGKDRVVWQRSIGNTDRSRQFAKSGGAMQPRDLTAFRHELGSVFDAERELLGELEPDERDLALHLIAAHHGRARPHFPDDELFDPEARGVDARAEGVRIMQRFARLQRRFGRWGLAYLESLVRAADYAASASPSQTEEIAR